MYGGWQLWKTTIWKTTATSTTATLITAMSIMTLVLCQDNGHIKPLLFGKISKMHKVVAFIPRFA